MTDTLIPGATGVLVLADGTVLQGKGFGAAGKPLNLIMTISRNGANFEGFLEGLLSRVSHGSTLPSAWAAMAPQLPGSRQQALPSCIFFAGRPDARLPG